MPLNQTAKYALRAMAILASLSPGAAISASALSELTDIPVHYLSKIMRRLVVHDLVVARRGHGGGFALSRPARKISFAEILGAADFEPEPGTCAFGWGKCDPANHCPLHETYCKLQDSVHEWMANTSLAQVAKDPRVER